MQNGLTRTEKETIIVEAVKFCANAEDENWTNLAQVGAIVRAKGLKYGKLEGMLTAFSNVLEFRHDYENYSPVTFVRLK